MVWPLWHARTRIVLTMLVLAVGMWTSVPPIFAEDVQSLLASDSPPLPPPAPPPTTADIVPVKAEMTPTGNIPLPQPALFPGPPASNHPGGPGDPPAVFGVLGLRGFFFGDHVASNGVEFKQLFSLDANFNIWLWRNERVYAYIDTRFWGQKAAPGITNANQGSFDFSKREFDLNGGIAWNFWDNWEARVFAYSFNNLNRGESQVKPTGFNDGLGLESRYYLSDAYGDLGTAEYDIARATFLSLGFYPTKNMIDTNGNTFKPGAFVRGYLTLDLFDPKYYLFTDSQFLTDRNLTPKLILTDTGFAARPFESLPRLEFRVGTEDIFDIHGSSPEYSGYLSVRYIY